MIIPLFVDSSVIVTKQFGKKIKDIGIATKIGQLQETILLGTARILQNIFEFWG